MPPWKVKQKQIIWNGIMKKTQLAFVLGLSTVWVFSTGSCVRGWLLSALRMEADMDF